MALNGQENSRNVWCNQVKEQMNTSGENICMFHIGNGSLCCRKKRVFYFITFILRVKWFCCVWNWLASPWFLLEGLKRLLWLVTADAFLTRVTVKPWSTKHFVPLLRWNMIKSRVRPTLFLQKLSEWPPPPPPWTLNVFFLFPKNGWKCKNLSCIVVFG